MQSKFFSDTKSIAELLGVSRMQLYRWSKTVPLPKWHHGYGARTWEAATWSQKQVYEWYHKVASKKQLHYRNIPREKFEDVK